MEQNLTFMLIETADEMQRTIEHISKVIEEQNELISTIMSSEKADKFKTFCDSLKTDIASTVVQKTHLLTRHALLTEIIEKCQQNEEFAILMSKLCRAFGIFDYISQK